MSAIPRASRLSSPTEVVAILVVAAAIWIAVFGGLIMLFVNVFIPSIQFSGRDQIPRDFPVFAGANLDSAQASVIGDCTSVNATWSTTSDEATVLTFYRGALSTDPWSITDDYNHRGQQELDFSSDSGGRHREGALTLETRAPDPGTIISIELYVPRTSTAGRSCHLPTAP